MMIGIDLGTTNSCVAWYDGTRTEVIEVPGGGQLLPSVVTYMADGKVMVGRSALRRINRAYDPRYVFMNAKRHIGLPFVEGEDYGPQIIEGKDGGRVFAGQTKDYTPVEISAEILRTLKDVAERRIGKKVTGAVITVPAYFENTPARIKATIEAGKLAGFSKVQTFTEPEAAALAFGVQKETYSKVAVFDLGGGTFDIVLMEAGRGAIRIADKNGWDELGGLNFDKEIENLIVERYASEHGIDLREKPISMMKIGLAAEDAKKELTDTDEAPVQIANVAFDEDQRKTGDIAFDLSREAFEARSRKLTDTAIEITKRCLDQVGWNVKEVREVLMVGGMTRVPMVRQAVADLFGEDRLRDRVSPDLAVAEGAAIKAALLDGRYVDSVSLNDVTGQHFGVEVEGGRLAVVLPRGSAHGDVRSVTVTTAQDQQDMIPIAIVQGEAGHVSGASVLARYDHRVSETQAGVPSIELDFMVDENGLLIVAGKDLDTDETFEVLGASA